MRFSYLQQGEGKDLVFLHGYLASKENFYGQINYFSKQYRVTALDFAGMGASETLTEPFSVGDYADWTARALESLHISFPHLIAHSFGGRVAIKMLSRGDVFDRVVLAGCAGIVKKRSAGYRLRVRAYRAVKRVAPKFAEAHFGSDDYRRLSPVMRESFKKIVNEDLREDAKRIARPVLFINGTEDRETPLSSVKILHACVANSALCLMEGCGHFVHLDDPLAFNLAAEEFLHDD